MDQTSAPQPVNDISMPSNPTPQPVAVTPMGSASTGKKGPGLVLAILFVVFILGGSVAFYFYSKAQVYKAALLLSSNFEESRDLLEKVDTSMKDLKGKVAERRQTGQNPSQSLVSSPTVLGTSVNKLLKDQKMDPELLTNLTDQVSVYSKVFELATLVNNNYSSLPKNKVFKAPSVSQRPTVFSSNDDLTRIVREEHDIATTGGKNVDDATEKVGELKTSFASAKDSTIKDSLKDANLTISDSEEFTSESKKVANYYTTITEVYIKLLPSLTQAYTLLNDITTTSTPQTYRSQITDLKNTYTELKNKLSGIPVSDLPSGIEELNRNNIKILEILETFMQNVGTAVDRLDAGFLVSSSQQFSSDLGATGTKAYTNELSFWQDTQVVKAYANLDLKFKKHSDSLQKVLDSSKTPFNK